MRSLRFSFSCAIRIIGAAQPGYASTRAQRPACGSSADNSDKCLNEPPVLIPRAARKDDGAQSIMLFGDRARGKALTVVKAAEPVIDEWQDVLLDLALHIGINKVVTSIR